MEVNLQAAARGREGLQFIESPKEAQFSSGILLRVFERSSVHFIPCAHDLLRKKDTDGVGRLSVGSDVEYVFGGQIFGGHDGRGALSDEVVLIHIALGTGIGLQSADSHGRRPPAGSGPALLATVSERDDTTVFAGACNTVEH